MTNYLNRLAQRNLTPQQPNPSQDGMQPRLPGRYEPLPQAGAAPLPVFGLDEGSSEQSGSQNSLQADMQETTWEQAVKKSPAIYRQPTVAPANKPAHTPAIPQPDSTSDEHPEPLNSLPVLRPERETPTLPQESLTEEASWHAARQAETRPSARVPRSETDAAVHQAVVPVQVHALPRLPIAEEPLSDIQPPQRRTSTPQPTFEPYDVPVSPSRRASTGDTLPLRPVRHEDTLPDTKLPVLLSPVKAQNQVDLAGKDFTAAAGEASETVVQISIGRLEVRARPTLQPATPKPVAPSGVFSLQEYLRQRSGGSSR